MKVKDFKTALSTRYWNKGFQIPIYYGGEEDNDEVFVDFESMREEFDTNMEELKDLVKEKDELTKIMKQKMKQITEKENA